MFARGKNKQKKHKVGEKCLFLQLIFNNQPLNRKLLSKNLFGLLVLFVLSPCAKAQVAEPFETNNDQQEQLFETLPPPKASVWLNAGTGAGFNETYDNGVAPMTLYGLGLGIQMGVTVEWDSYHIQSETRVPMGMLLLPLEGFNINVQERLELLYRIHDGKRNQLHFWAGGAALFDLNIKQLPSLMNASTGGTMFANLSAVGMVQYDFEFVNGGSHNLFSVYGKLTLPLGGAVARPGYAYMDNYTSDLNAVNTILGEYEWFGKAFSGISTDIGIYLNLLNGNRIGISYRWDYLSTGKKGTYRFDNAFHTLNLDFMFRLF